MNGQLIRFGPFLFDPDNRTLGRDGQFLSLGVRSAKLLLALVEAGGEVVTKEKLFDIGWSGRTVEESNLTVQIAALRKSLGRRPDGDDWIRTVSRIGYRLSFDVAARAGAEPPDRPGLLRCAVLPFRTDPSNPNESRFAEGLADDLITDLSRLPDLRVTTRNSSFRYGHPSAGFAQIAQELGVRYLIHGSVRRDGRRLRVNIRVIDAIEDTSVWGGRFDGDDGEVFALQDRIAADVIGGLTKVVSSRSAVASRPQHPQANQLFLRGRALVSQWSDDNIAGRELLHRALEVEPDFARAHAWLSHSHHFSWLFDYDSDPADRGRADAHAQRAILLDPQEPDACWSHGIACAYGGNLDLAAMHLGRALELNPSHADAWVFLSDVHVFNGRAAEAIDCIRTAFVLNPFPPELYQWHLGFAEYAAARYIDALQTLERAAAYRAGPKRTLAATLARLGRHDEARAVAADFMRTHPRFSIRRWAERHPFANEQDRDHFVDGYRMAGLPD